MNISELKPGTGSVNIEAEVTSIEATREINNAAAFTATDINPVTLVGAPS